MSTTLRPLLSTATSQEVIALVTHLRSSGLFLPRRALLRAGFSDAGIQAALANKRIFRVRQGWFGLPDSPPDAIIAVRVGGRLTGEAALRSYQIWTRPRFITEVVVRANANGLRRPSSRRQRLTESDRKHIRICWNDDDPIGGDPWRVSLYAAVLHLLRTATREVALTAIDSALNRGAHGATGLTVGQVDRLFDEAPARVRGWRTLVDARAEAGGETLIRLLCHDHGIPFEPQAVVPGVGRLDGQIGPHTFAEADGAHWHDNETAFYRDRERDVASAIVGHRTLRFSYPQLTQQPERCVQAMLAARAQDPGLRPHKPAVKKRGESARHAERNDAKTLPTYRSPRF